MPEEGQKIVLPQQDITEQNNGLWEKVATRVLLGKPDVSITSNPEYQAALPQLRELYKQVWRWHGTGRFQYDDNDQVSDVLKGIVYNNGLIPHEDPLDYTQGVMHSISTSPSRTYSSLYAMLHFEKWKKLRNTFQTTAGWLYYTGTIALEAALHDRRLFSKKFRESNNLSKEGTGYFHAKYTKSDVPGFDMGKGGMSDIPGNYPMLVGIRNGAFQEVDIAQVLKKHESRSKTPIVLSDFTHIEVPQQYVTECKDIIEQAGTISVPVIPLEWGEELSKSLPVSFLKDGIPLK